MIIWRKDREAREKICPFLRPDFQVDHERINGPSFPETAIHRVMLHPRCVGSDCMAWEWGAEGTNNPPPRGPRDTEAKGCCAAISSGHCGTK